MTDTDDEVDSNPSDASGVAPADALWSEIAEILRDQRLVWPILRDLLTMVHDHGTAPTGAKRERFVAAVEHLDQEFDAWGIWRSGLPRPATSLRDRLFGYFGLLPPSTRTGLVERVDCARCSALPPLAVAREIARAIDRDPLMRLWLQWQWRSEWESPPDETAPFTFETNRPYPVTWPRVHGAAKGALTSPPWTLELRDWESRSVRFWSSDEVVPLRMKLTWSGDATASLSSALRGGQVTRILTLHPFNAAWPICWLKHYLGDFHVKPGHLPPASAATPSPSGRQFGPRPRIEAGKAPDDTSELPSLTAERWTRAEKDFAEEFAAWVIAQLKKHAPVDVAVIPEFCMTPVSKRILCERLEAQLQSASDRRLVPGVMVPGSWYDDDKPTVSHYEVWVRGHKRLFVHRATKQLPLEGEWARRTPTPTFTLLQCGDLRVAVGLCRDLLTPDLAPLLRRAGANLVIAPANTTNTEVFANELRGITATNQAVGVVANSPTRHPGWDFHHPLDYHDWKPGHGTPPNVDLGHNRFVRSEWAVTDLAVYAHPVAASRPLSSGPLTGDDMSPAAITHRGEDYEASAWTTLLSISDTGEPTVEPFRASKISKEYDCACT